MFQIIFYLTINKMAPFCDLFIERSLYTKMFHWFENFACTKAKAAHY